MLFSSRKRFKSIIKQYHTKEYMVQVIPAILTDDLQTYREQVQDISSFSEQIQIDIEDGSFVPGTTVLPSDMDEGDGYEAHLMTDYPSTYFETISKKGFTKVLYHHEAKTKEDVIQKAKQYSLETVIAVNPETSIDDVPLTDFNTVLLLGVTPGKQGQTFQKKIYDKIQTIHNTTIQVDGGVKPEQAYHLGKKGVTKINVGSYIAEAENKKRAYNKVKKELKRGHDRWKQKNNSS